MPERSMHIYGQLIHVEETRRDSIVYRIAIFRVQGGLHGAWSCSACAADDDQNGTHPTIDEAVTSVKNAIERHHRERHER